MRSRLLLAATVAVMAGVALFATHGRRDAPPPRDHGGPASGAAPVPPEPPSPTPPVDEALAGLAAALRTPDDRSAPEAAAALRRRLRTDPEAFRLAAAALLDPARSEEERAALALVLGTIPGAETDAALLAALADPAAGSSLRRALLLALGATRDPPEDDEVFDLGDQPWGEPGPGGLGITVRREIVEDAVRRALLAGLSDPEPNVRRAAAAALRHSLGFPDATDGFLARLPAEEVDAVAAVLGEGLAVRARRADPAVRDQLVETVLARAAAEGSDEMRLRVENDLERIPLPAAARDRLRALAAPSRPFGDRSFALTVLAGSAAAAGGGDLAEVRGLLSEALARDADPAARDLAARLTGTLPADDAGRAALGAAAREDAAWNVRHAALTALARLGPAEAVRPVLEAAAEDPDPRVAEQARRLLGEPPR